MSGEGSLALAVTLTRAWTRVYSAGLPPPVRARRRLEIEADIADLVADSHSNGRRTGEIAAHVAARLLLGVADDLAWRAEEAPRRGARMALWLVSAAMLAAVVAGAWLNALTRIELPVPEPMMSFVEAPPPPPPWNPPPPPPPPSFTR